MKGSSPIHYTSEELREALEPIASLISKSEKAQQKLPEGTWQHAMLRDNLKSLRMAAALIKKESTLEEYSGDDLQEALRAIASMIDKSEKAQMKFIPGDAQHSLLRNRLRALRIAETLLKARSGGAANRS